MAVTKKCICIRAIPEAGIYPLQILWYEVFYVEVYENPQRPWASAVIRKRRYRLMRRDANGEEYFVTRGIFPMDEGIFLHFFKKL